MASFFVSDPDLSDFQLRQALGTVFPDILIRPSEAAEGELETIRSACHDLFRELGVLNMLVARYRRIETRLSEPPKADLGALTAELQQLYLRLHQMTKEPTEWLFGGYGIKQRTDLVQLIRGCCGNTVQILITNSEPQENFEIDIEPKRFQRVLVELRRNAERYGGDPSTLKISIAVEPLLRDGQPWAQLRFSDNGPGIPEAIKERIFERYYQAVTNANATGTGYGLYEVRRIIQGHGGTIIECGIYRQGACFKIEMPRYDQQNRT